MVAWSHDSMVINKPSSIIDYGIRLVSFSDHVGVMLGSVWGHMLGSVWGHVGVSLGSCWAQFEVMLGSVWGHVGVILGS